MYQRENSKMVIVNKIAATAMMLLLLVSCQRESLSQRMVRSEMQRCPTAADLESAYATLEKIRFVSRLDVTGIVNNANLAGETDHTHLVEGYELVKALSLRTGIPVWGTCGVPKVLDDFNAYAKEHGLDEQYIGVRPPITVYMHRSWDKFLTEGL